MSSAFHLWAFVLGLSVAGLSAQAGEPEPIRASRPDRPTPVDFEKELLPLFKANCLACHHHTRAKADRVLETPRLS
ncbi:MAG: hypothetical protein U1G07_03835 [Verrucomicrobiota bacterium]